MEEKGREEKGSEGREPLNDPRYALLLHDHSDILFMLQV